MNSLKTTNILLLLLVLLLAIHVGVESFRPIGRYQWTRGFTDVSALDTATGKFYGFDSDLKSSTTIDILALSKNANAKGAITFSRRQQQ